MYPYIHSIAYYLPEKKLSNKKLCKEYGEWDDNKIFSKTGIIERRISAENETVSDMAVKAASALFNESRTDPAEVDFMILCTQSPDYFLPTTACIVQDRLKLSVNCGALDFNLGCSGFIYGLMMAKALIISKEAKCVLLITSEAYSKHIHPMDKSTRTVFGDGAAAVLIKSDSEDEKIGRFILGTDGRGAENLIVPAGGMKLPRSEKTCVAQKDDNGNLRSLNNLYMDGPEIFNFTIRTVPELVKNIMKKNGIEFEDIDLFVFHQANRYILDYLREKLKIPREKFYVNMAYTGNTVASTIPIALKKAQLEGRLDKTSRVLLAGFGVGYSWGGTMIKL